MAEKNTTKKSSYISAKESRRITRFNRRITKKLEAARADANKDPKLYTTKMRDPNNVVEFDNVCTYFFTDVGVVRSVDGVNFDVPKCSTVGVVGESGCGKSVTSLSLMQLLQRHTDIPFETEFLVMDPGYNAENRQRIIDNAALMEIPIRIFDSSIFETTKIAERNPCYLCARMRRGFLYDRAQEMGCNKIALGHHFNDVVETTVMGMFYGAQLQAMLPKLHSRNFPGMELIRPMYCIHEEDICAWRDFNDLHFIACACRLTEERDKSGDGIGNSKRAEIKQLLKTLRETNPDVEKNVFSAIHAVSLDTMPGWKIGEKEYSFLDDYDHWEATHRPADK